MKSNRRCDPRWPELVVGPTVRKRRDVPRTFAVYNQHGQVVTGGVSRVQAWRIVRKLYPHFDWARSLKGLPNKDHEIVWRLVIDVRTAICGPDPQPSVTRVRSQSERVRKSLAGSSVG